MNEVDDFKKLRKLCELHYQRQIEFSIYRQEVRDVLDKIETEHTIFSLGRQEQEESQGKYFE